MIDKMKSLLHQLIPENLAEKGLSKVDPRMGKFFSNATKSGIGTTAALSFLRNKFQNPVIESEKSRLSQGVKKGTLRPDERVAAQEIQQGEQRAGTLKQLATAGLATAGGLGAFGGLSNVLGQSVTENESEQPQMQTQTKQPSPLSRAGLQEQNQPGSSAMNGIDKLFSFIESRVSKGEPLQKAVSTARANTAFKPIIAAAEQETGMPFIDIVKSRFSGYGQPEQQQGQGSGKQEFLAGLSQLTQALQGLRNR